jgi:acyl-CoA oxidase
MWPGDLGVSATHCVTHARLIINNKDHGVQTFFLQVRDKDNHKPLDGITIEEIGPKLGYRAKDNGLMYFKQFKAPKTSLLSRFVNVNEGKLQQIGDPKVAYAVMMKIRTRIASTASRALAIGLLIATRYALVRT